MGFNIRLYQFTQEKVTREVRKISLKCLKFGKIVLKLPEIKLYKIIIIAHIRLKFENQ